MDADDRARLDADRGYREVGLREVRFSDWLAKGSAKERAEFKRLVWRLQAKKYWKAKNPDSRARILAYRKRWREENLERWRESIRKAKARGRKAGAKWYRADKKRQRAQRAAAKAARRAATIYVCQNPACGAQWSPAGPRIPARPPKWCSLSCRGRVVYQTYEKARRARLREEVRRVA